MQPTAVAWCVRVTRRSSRGVCESFDDRRPSSLQTTIVVPTKIAWCVPSFRKDRHNWAVDIQPIGQVQWTGIAACDITVKELSLISIAMEEVQIN